MATHALTINGIQFEWRSHPANPLAYMQRDVFFKLSDNNAQWQFVRSFFLDDAQNIALIQKFCERLAHDPNYRAAALRRDTPWAKRNDLFLRNCFNPYFQPNPCLRQLGGIVSAYRYFTENTDAILIHPDYQRIHAHDTATVSQPQQPDPYIAPIVTALNSLPNTKTLASCQGVSGTLDIEGINIMTLSTHARYAYIWFVDLPAALARRLYVHPAITYETLPHPTLRATDDNAAFLAALSAEVSASK